MLDEIGELALTHQTKLLRALDAREIVPVGGTRSVRVDAPVIAATNVELLAETADEFLRADLHARLAGSVIHMPPLGERRGDVLALARSFLAQEPGGRRLSTHAAERLLLHPWPRNVRELLSTMRRVSLHIVGDRAKITRADIDAVLDPVVTAPQAIRVARVATPPRDELAAMLASVRGNVSRLAEHDGKDGKQIYRWLWWTPAAAIRAGSR